KPARLASLDAFRGLSVLLMMVADYAGPIFPAIGHAPWNGVHLADLVMPFFLFIVGVSVAIVYRAEKVPRRDEATWKALLRAMKLFLLGVFLQSGYLHGAASLTYGVDVAEIRFLGILQRIAIGYIAAALCEIWLPCKRWRRGYGFSWQWCVMVLLCGLYSGLLYGLYVPDWEFKELQSNTTSHVYQVKCSVRGDLGPACNSAGMIDRYILGINHLYKRPGYRNLKECKGSSSRGQVPETSPPWCHAPFDPEGILSSISATVTCIIGLQYGHALTETQHHKGRIWNWSVSSFSLMGVGLLLSSLGMPLNKCLYTVSYQMVASSAAGIAFCLLYITASTCYPLSVDVYGWWRWASCGVEWMGKHSLGIFILVSSNVVVILVQGFYLEAPENNIVHWLITRLVH
ncbi:hypothetical protein M569_08853, partial [Genlisea aurea]